MDRFTGGFSSDSTWTIHGDYGLFGINDTKGNSILSEFGWNFQQPPPKFDQIDYGGCCGVPEETNPTTSAVAIQSQAGSVENTGDVSVSNPLVSSSSFEDRPETSAASGDAASSGKPQSLETGLEEDGGDYIRRTARKIPNDFAGFESLTYEEKPQHSQQFTSRVDELEEMSTSNHISGNND
ncbi:hypothetical protein L6452_08683 [Arctium lappa]|uniref:Uncharacterized protein n=1 Tax=Arctium lappa TaxID=4217 RepID=A0ACB9DHV8_ARCLA|nr:hypothetical protein L6452_08683 [Arctium lappa]